MATYDVSGIPVVLNNRNYRVVFEGADAVRVSCYRQSGRSRPHTYVRWRRASGSQPPADIAKAIALATQHRELTGT